MLACLYKPPDPQTHAKSPLLHDEDTKIQNILTTPYFIIIHAHYVLIVVYCIIISAANM